MNFSEYKNEQKIRVHSFVNEDLYQKYIDSLYLKVEKLFSCADSKKILSALDFAESIEYLHSGMTEKQYLIHPLRVANIVLDHVENVSADLVILSLLHNILEVSKVDVLQIKKLFGEKICKSISLLVVDRSNQWDKKYKKLYYDNLSSADEIVPIVKVFDKLDNIYLLCTNPSENIRKMYIYELLSYVTVLSSEYAPQVFEILKSAINFSIKDGYIPLDKLMSDYDL